MKEQTYIVSNWNSEVQRIQETKKATIQQRFEALKEFKESVCDLFDMADFYYYAERVNCNVGYLLRIAKYSTDKNYVRPARNLEFRRWFYSQNGHSITKRIF